MYLMGDIEMNVKGMFSWSGRFNIIIINSLMRGRNKGIELNYMRKNKQGKEWRVVSTFPMQLPQFLIVHFCIVLASLPRRYGAAWLLGPHLEVKLIVFPAKTIPLITPLVSLCMNSSRKTIRSSPPFSPIL